MKQKEPSSDFFSRLWKFFSSVRLTVVLLLTLAATSIIGTIVPQNDTLEAYIHEYGEFWYRLLSSLSVFDMYHSWWFQFLLITLTVNIVICSWERLSGTGKIVFEKPSLTLSRFKNDYREEMTVESSPEKLKELYEPMISRIFGHVKTEQTDNGFCIFAEKGRWTRLGVYAVHVSVVLLLLGGLIGSKFGFEGYVNIPEGETADTIHLRKTEQARKLDFEIRCDDFNVSFYNSGAPKEYRSTLTLLEAGKSVLKKDIIVNDPLRYKGINLYQSSYGSLPPDEVTLTITSSESKLSYSQKAVMGKPFDLPEGLGQFVLSDFSNSYNFMGRNIGETFFGIIDPGTKNAKDIIIPSRFPNFDKMRKGSFVVSLSDYNHRYYTGLQVTKDPGVLIVYTGFIMMIIGIYITFFMSHQRLCVEVHASGDKSNVTVMGNANKNKMGMKLQIKKMLQRLAKA